MTEQEAITVFEEILAIDYRDTIPKYYEAMELAVKDMKEVKKYRTIGTLEECREAVEKQTDEKPTAVLGTFFGKEYECKNCGSDVCYGDEYCRWCGQKLDWSDEE